MTTTINHGLAAYVHHHCRCAICRAANTEYRRGQKANRVANTPFDAIPHGGGGYRNYNCRCDVCRYANTLDSRDYRARMRERSENE